MNNSSVNSQLRITSDTKIILYCIVLVWSLIGNVLVIAAVLSNANIKTRFNYLIVNMAVSDLVVPLVTMPIMIADNALQNEWLVHGAFGNALCKLTHVIIDVSPTVSVFSLVVIAANRYLAIVHPMQLKNLSGKRLGCIIAMIWLLSTVLLAPRFYTVQVLKSPSGYPKCSSKWKSLSQITYNSFFVIILFFIPFTAIIVLYSIILYKMRKMSKNIKMMLSSQEACSRQKQNRKMFQVSVVVILVFALFWGPFFSLVFVWNFIWDLRIPPHVEPYLDSVLFIVQFLGFLNAAINPCVYFLLFKGYREGLRKMFHCSERQRNVFEIPLLRLNTNQSSLPIVHSGRELQTTSDV